MEIAVHRIGSLTRINGAGCQSLLSAVNRLRTARTGEVKSSNLLWSTARTRQKIAISWSQ